ncbi:HCLS1-associated protein X-1 [Apteryx rowi]|uniref:HCLS1-associated protein X-1 n=1 Tax=Apteryx rowi TaxID=308060 RepID=UPI000E1E2048|nr:HCLS1-associated protein X-1 [Apteryx rowi]
MSFYDVFRGFFGFPGARRPRDPLFGDAAWDEEDEEDDGDGDGDGWAPPRPPEHFGFGGFEELLRDVGELLGAFGGAGAGPPQPFGLPLPSPGEDGVGRPLRDSMLKHPDGPAPPEGPGAAREPARRPWRPFLGREDPQPAPPGLKEDQDLDSQVSSAGLGTILQPDEPKPRSYFQSVSITKVTLPDGAVEERRTVQDSQGRRETTVTRRRGDQAFIATTKEDGESRDYREEVVNMDDRELARFADAWQQHDELRAPGTSDSSSALGRLFRRWFSGW